MKFLARYEPASISDCVKDRLRAYLSLKMLSNTSNFYKSKMIRTSQDYMWYLKTTLVKSKAKTKTITTQTQILQNHFVYRAWKFHRKVPKQHCHRGIILFHFRIKCLTRARQVQEINHLFKTAFSKKKNPCSHQRIQKGVKSKLHCHNFLKLQTII